MTREQRKAVLVSILIFVPVCVAIVVTAALGGSDTTIFVSALVIGLLAAAVVGNTIH